MKLQCVLTFLLLGGTSVVSGFVIYKDRIPNGQAVPHPCKPNYLWHGVGHKNALGGGSRNAFGVDFLEHGASWTAELCRKDSDGDGRTNGEELGDPQCIWKKGDLASSVTGITHPGVCEPWDDARCEAYNTWVDCDTATLKCDALKTDPDVKNVTFRFPPTQVPSTETNYYCMTFDLPDDDDYHLIADEPFITNAQVMHHILVYACEGDDPPTIGEPTSCGMSASSGCDSIMALWTVGFPGSCLMNTTGFPFGKNGIKRIKLEFHWNNPELRSDYTDSSGMTLHYTKNLRPNNAGVFMVGQSYLEIPPLQPTVQITGSCPGDCSRYLIKQPIKVFASLNHMHYLGRSQKVELYRNGRFVTHLTNEDVYSYDSPIVHSYDSPIEILPGDDIRTTCVYSSASREYTTFYGDGTSAEMCFAFLMVYPAEALASRACVGQRSLSLCELYGGGKCSIQKFFNTSDPGVLRLFNTIGKQCTPFSCRPECKDLMDRLTREEPCLQGDFYEYVKEELLESHEGTVFVAKMESCRPRYQCPTCRRCDNSTTFNDRTIGNNNNNNNDDSTDSAASLLPQLFVTLVVLVAALLLS